MRCRRRPLLREITRPRVLEVLQAEDGLQRRRAGEEEGGKREGPCGGRGGGGAGGAPEYTGEIDGCRGGDRVRNGGVDAEGRGEGEKEGERERRGKGKKE